MVQAQETMLRSGADAFDRNWFSHHGVIKITAPAADLHYWVFDPPGLASSRTGASRGYEGTVMLLSGWGGSALSSQYLFPLAIEMHKARFKVIMIDLRGQGFSTGDTCTYGLLDSADFTTVIKELNNRDELRGSIIVAGHSYGAAAAIQIASHNPHVKAAVSLSGPCELMSLGPTVRGLVSFSYPKLYWFSRPLLSDWAVRAGILLASSRHGVDPEKSSAIAALRSMTSKVLIVHGDNDICVPVEHAKRIFNGRPEGTKIMLLVGHDHWSYLGSPDVIQSIVSWLPRDSTSLR